MFNLQNHLLCFTLIQYTKHSAVLVSLVHFTTLNEKQNYMNNIYSHCSDKQERQAFIKKS